MSHCPRANASLTTINTMSLLTKDTLWELLQLDDDWKVGDVRYCRTSATLTVSVEPTDAIWTRTGCPQCRCSNPRPQTPAKTTNWRHLDGFHVKTLIECALPRAKCLECGHLFQIKPSWQGRCRHFTKGFESYALSVIRETTVRSASRVLSESDQRLWRLLYSYLEGAQGELSTIAISILHREWNKPSRSPQAKAQGT